MYAELNKMDSNYMFVKIAGLSPRDGNSHIFFMGEVILISQIFFYLCKIRYERDELTLEAFIEITHWIIIIALVGFSSFSLYANINYYYSLNNKIKSNFYQYPQPLTEEQENQVTEANESVRFYRKIFIIFMMFSAVTTTCKDPLFNRGDKEYVIPFKIYVPFEINSVFRYTTIMIYQSLVAFSITFFATNCMMTFLSIILQINGQINVLLLAFSNAFKQAKGNSEQNEPNLIKRLKHCIAHHIVITEAFTELQNAFSYILLSMSLGMSMAFCTLGGMMTNKDSDIFSLLTWSFLCIPELMCLLSLCLCGEKLKDLGESISTLMYEYDWYNHSKKVNTLILILMIRCYRPLQISGAGLQEYSLKGFSDIVQTAYSFFSVILALRES